MKSSFERPTSGKHRSGTSIHDLPEHPLVERYRPRFIGQGTENIVYEAVGSKGVVLKANKVVLAESISGNASAEELEKTKLAEARKAYEDLRRVFGEHVLPQKQYLLEVPYNTGVLYELKLIAKVYGWKIPEEGEGTGWTIVSVQRRTKAMEDFHRLSMGGGGLEGQLAQRPTFDVPESAWPLYAKVTDALSSRERAEQSNVGAKELEVLYGRTRLPKLIEKANQDSAFREALADFQRKAVRHAEETGDILDVIGEDNIIFNKQKDGSWDYTLVDAIYPFEKQVLHRAKQALTATREGRELAVSERITLREAVGYVRAINALGKALGTGTYIDFVPAGAEWAVDDLAKVVTGRGRRANVKKTTSPEPAVATAVPPPSEELPDLPPAHSRKPGGLFGPIPNFQDRLKGRR